MLKLHDRPYHRVMGCFRGSYEGTTQNNSRMYIYDHELQSRETELQLDSDTVQFLAQQLKYHNSWASMYRALLLENEKKRWWKHEHLL